MQNLLLIVEGSTEDKMTERDWDAFVRWCGIGASIVVLMISIFFSSWGFSFDMKNYDWAIWVSATLGAVITVIELNGYKTEKRDTAFTVIWILAYVYGVYTNIVGLIQIRGGATEIGDYILPVIVGAFIEVVPEKLFIKSLRELNEMRKKPITTAAPYQQPPLNQIKTSLPTPKMFPGSNQNQHKGHGKPNSDKKPW